MSDLIDRQAAITAICNACGKIDCDQVDKCDKLQLPPANTSEIPNSSDTISRQAAITTAVRAAVDWHKLANSQYSIAYCIGEAMRQLPSAQPERTPMQELLDVTADRDYWKAQCHSYEMTINRLTESALPENRTDKRTETHACDCISRQQAIDALGEYLIGKKCPDDGTLTARLIENNVINKLPPAQPKTGKWILDRSGAYCCSECMEPCAGYVMMKPRDKFCKMCGAKMEVEHD